MPFKLQTLEKKIYLLPLSENVQIVKSFLNYMNDNGLSINNKINSLNSVIPFGMHIGQKSFFKSLKKRFLPFLIQKSKVIMTMIILMTE